MIPDTIFMNEVYPLLPPNENKYCFALLDGPHDDPSVLKEVNFFSDKIVTNGVMMIDDFGEQNSMWETINKSGWERGSFSNHIYAIRRT